MPAPAPYPNPSDKGNLKKWVKKHLQALGPTLANLSGKAAAALPGIIGSKYCLLAPKYLRKDCNLACGELWAMAIAMGTLLLVAARDWLTTHIQNATRPSAIPPLTKASFLLHGPLPLVVASLLRAAPLHFATQHG